MIVAANVLAALLFPLLGQAIGFDTTSGESFGIFAGTAVNDTSSVTAAASTWDSMWELGSQTLDKAVTVKLTRTLAIIPITLVLALDMGTRGAALSTALGQIITIAIYLPGFFGQKHTLRFALPRGRWLVPALSALKAGMATSVQYLYQMIFFLVCNNLLIRLGGETAVAVFDDIQNTSYLILYLFEGTGRAMQPILSTYQGEYNRQGMRNTVRLGFTAGLTVGGALIVLVELWPAGMCSASPVRHRRRWRVPRCGSTARGRCSPASISCCAITIRPVRTKSRRSCWRRCAARCCSSR